MRRLSGFLILSLSIITTLTLILAGCSSASPSTSAPPPAQTNSAAPPPPAPTTNAAPPPPQTTSAPPPPAQTTSGPASSTSTEPIKIGAMMDLSGPFSVLSTFEVPGVQIVIDKVNATGGLLGRQVQLITRDDRSDPTVGSQKADELKSAGVVGIIGTTAPPVNEALGIWAKSNHIPIGSGLDADMDMRTTNFSGYNYFCCPTGWTYAKILAQWAASQDKIKSVYAIAADLGTNHVIVDSFWPFMKQLKPSVINAGVVYTGMAEQDFSTTISTALSKKPDLLLDMEAGPSGASFIKQAQQLGAFKVTTIAGAYLLGTDATAALGKDYPTGIVAIDNCPYWVNTPEMQSFVKEFFTKTKMYPDSSTMAFYLSTLSLVEAIKKANSTDPDKIIKALETLTITDSPLGSFSYHDYDHQGEVPCWLNVSGFSSDYPYAIGLNPVKYQQGIYPTKDDIMALRNAK